MTKLERYKDQLEFVRKNEQGYDEYRNKKDGYLLVHIPAITATIGTDLTDGGVQDEGPQHQVELEDYFIGVHPITVAQYRRFVEETGYHVSEFCAGLLKNMDMQDHPITYVSIPDSVAYLVWAGLRLPTEVEWEHAYRGPNNNVFPWGNEWDSTKCHNSVDSEKTGTAAIGSYPSGVSHYGAHDMAGNVWEWTSTEFKSYPYSPTDGREDYIRDLMEATASVPFEVL